MLTIEVVYTETWSGTESPEIERKAEIEITDAKPWVAGLKYTYPLQVTKSGIILMSEPGVAPWPGNATQVGGDITIKN